MSYQGQGHFLYEIKTLMIEMLNGRKKKLKMINLLLQKLQLPLRRKKSSEYEDEEEFDKKEFMNSCIELWITSQKTRSLRKIRVNGVIMILVILIKLL
jgi:hypothetical protein